MHRSLTERLAGKRRDQCATFTTPRTGAFAIASLVANFLESFDEALVPMDDDVQQSAGVSAR